MGKQHQLGSSAVSPSVPGVCGFVCTEMPWSYIGTPPLGKGDTEHPTSCFSREELGHMELVCLENAGAGDLEREELAPGFMLQVSLFPLSFPVYSLSHPRVLGCVSLERCSYHDQAPHKVLAS